MSTDTIANWKAAPIDQVANRVIHELLEEIPQAKGFEIFSVYGMDNYPPTQRTPFSTQVLKLEILSPYQCGNLGKTGQGNGVIQTKDVMLALYHLADERNFDGLMQSFPEHQRSFFEGFDSRFTNFLNGSKPLQRNHMKVLLMLSLYFGGAVR